MADLPPDDGFITVTSSVNRIKPPAGPINSGFNINEFMSSGLRDGLLKSSLYLCEFGPTGVGQDIPRNMYFYTSDIQLPPVTMAVQEIFNYGRYGQQQKVPYKPLFDDILIDFYSVASNDAALLTFHKIIRNTINYGDTVSAQSGGSASASQYEIEYRKNLYFTFKVFIYNEQQESILVYTFRDAWVRSVGGLVLGWGQHDNLMKTNAFLAYTDYIVEAADASENGINRIPSLSTLQQILKLGSVAQTISAIRRPQSIGDVLNIVNNANIVASGYGI